MFTAICKCTTIVYIVLTDIEERKCNKKQDLHLKNNQSIRTLSTRERVQTHTSHAQNFSTVFLGGGSSYDAASTSFNPERKSISAGATGVHRYQNREPMYRIGKRMNGR